MAKWASSFWSGDWWEDFDFGKENKKYRWDSWKKVEDEGCVFPKPEWLVNQLVAQTGKKLPQFIRNDLARLLFHHDVNITPQEGYGWWADTLASMGIIEMFRPTTAGSVHWTNEAVELVMEKLLKKSDQQMPHLKPEDSEEEGEGGQSKKDGKGKKGKGKKGKGDEGEGEGEGQGEGESEEGDGKDDKGNSNDQQGTEGADGTGGAGNPYRNKPNKDEKKQDRAPNKSEAEAIEHLRKELNDAMKDAMSKLNDKVELNKKRIDVVRKKQIAKGVGIVAESRHLTSGKLAYQARLDEIVNPIANSMGQTITSTIGSRLLSTAPLLEAQSPIGFVNPEVALMGLPPTMIEAVSYESQGKCNLYVDISRSMKHYVQLPNGLSCQRIELALLVAQKIFESGVANKVFAIGDYVWHDTRQIVRNANGKTFDVLEELKPIEKPLDLDGAVFANSTNFAELVDHAGMVPSIVITDGSSTVPKRCEQNMNIVWVLVEVPSNTSLRSYIHRGQVLLLNDGVLTKATY